MSVERIRRRIMLKREPKTGNLEQGTILSEGTITFTIYVSVSF